MRINIKEFEYGEYRHFKGNFYMVYGIAEDRFQNQYVLYRQQYGDKSFWLRPADMFLEMTKDSDGKECKRFSKTKSKFLTFQESLKTLVEILKESDNLIYFKHTENLTKYMITSFIYNEETYNIKVFSFDSQYSSSYLSDHQIAWRMGYYLFECNESRFFKKLSESDRPKEDKTFLLNIKDNMNNIKIEERLKNPCSVDLHIADVFFAKTRRKKIDMLSLNVQNSNPQDFWKKIKLKDYHGKKGFKLKPHQMVLTHTLEKITIPCDCAGKIEIRSTYARLSLSVTTTDFCNPGWQGCFPLFIRNDGTNSIILHPEEQMLQIMLLPVEAPIINLYRNNSTYMDDDGTPFRFWNAKTVNRLHKEIGNDYILNFYKDKLCKYSGNEKERFECTFIGYCEKKKSKSKYRTHENCVDINKIFDNYIKKERLLNIISKVLNRTVIGVGGMLSILFEGVILSSSNPKILSFKVPMIFVSVFFIIIFVISIYLGEKNFCISKGENS